MFQLSYGKPLNCLNPTVDVQLVTELFSIKEVFGLFHLKPIWSTPIKLVQVRQGKTLFAIIRSQIS